MNKTVRIKVFLPVGVCSCSYVGFLGRLYAAIAKFRNNVEYYEDTVMSDEAQKHGIRYQGVLIGSTVLKGNITTEEVEQAIEKELQLLSQGT